VRNWIGIGTTETSAGSLGQQGADLNGSAWFETNFGNTDYIGMHVGVGSGLYMVTHWTGEGYTYYFHNVSTGQTEAWGAGSSVASGQYTAYIAEMPAPWSALANFGTVTFVLADAAIQGNPISDYPVDRAIMRASDGDVLATPSGLSLSPVAFTVTQNTCD
jgi:hypothetical protein